MPYSDDFPKSSRTERWASMLPSWTKAATDELSIWQQFTNAPALMIDNAYQAAEHELNNRFIGKANIDELAWTYRVTYMVPVSQFEHHTVEGMLSGGTYQPLKVAQTLREFYDDDKSACIFDFDKHILYMRSEYDSIRIDGQHVYTDIVPHHAWNCFDEFALLAGLRRRPRETNASLKARTQQAWQYLMSANKLGVIFGIASQLGLVRAVDWSSGADPLVVGSVEPPLSPHIGSIKIGSRTILPQEYTTNDDGTVTVHRHIMAPIGDATSEGCIMRHGRVKLADNIINGRFVTPVLSEAYVDQWQSMVTTCGVPAGATITVDVLHYDIDYPLISGLLPNDELLLDPENQVYVAGPIRLAFHLSRTDTSVDSPYVDDCMLTYIGSDCVVNFIADQDVHIDTMYDETFRRTEMFDMHGEPTAEMRRYVSELSDVSPITWGKFRWDQGYWDIVDSRLTSMEWLPNHIDIDLDSINAKYRQIGIGDKLDLHIKLGEQGTETAWNTHIHAGYYYIDNNMIEHYMYVDPSSEEFVGPVDTITLQGTPRSHAPITVLADDTYLTCVAFLDDDNSYSITNTESVASDGTTNIRVAYANLDMDTVTVPGYTVNTTAYTGDNNIPLTAAPSAGETLEVSYRVKHTFAVNVVGDVTNIVLSQPYNSIAVTYETDGDNSYHVDEQLTMSPVKTHINHGFIYIANESQQPVSMRVLAHPDSVRADSNSRAIVCVDAYDRHGNPCQIAADWFSASVDYGSIIQSGTYANRAAFMYTAPDAANTPPDNKATITITDGQDVPATTHVIVIVR